VAVSRPSKSLWGTAAQTLAFGAVPERFSTATSRFTATCACSREARRVRNTLAYVLNNWRHHGEDKLEIAKDWVIDPFASGLWFTGWKERDDNGYTYRAPPGYRGFVVWQPSLWLLREGWKRWGLISVHEVPGGGAE
jgi:hypothetical protein